MEFYHSLPELQRIGTGGHSYNYLKLLAKLEISGISIISYHDSYNSRGLGEDPGTWAVWNQWNGIVEWNSGMECWNDP